MPEKALQSVKNDYEGLNAQLLDELPKLYSLSIQLLQGCIAAFVQAQREYVNQRSVQLSDTLDVSIPQVPLGSAKHSKLCCSSLWCICVNGVFVCLTVEIQVRYSYLLCKIFIILSFDIKDGDFLKRIVYIHLGNLTPGYCLVMFFTVFFFIFAKNHLLQINQHYSL